MVLCHKYHRHGGLTGVKNHNVCDGTHLRLLGIPLFRRWSYLAREYIQQTAAAMQPMLLRRIEYLLKIYFYFLLPVRFNVTAKVPDTTQASPTVRFLSIIVGSKLVVYILRIFDHRKHRQEVVISNLVFLCVVTFQLLRVTNTQHTFKM